MRKVYHRIKANMQSNLCDYAPIDIHQNDAGSHVLLVQLCNNRRDFIPINKEATAKVGFYLNEKLIATDYATIEDYDRGVVSYVLGKSIVRKYGRYVVELTLMIDDAEISVKFLVTIAKSHDYSPSSSEVVITRELYEKIVSHLRDSDKHLSEEDRDFLDTFSDRIEDLQKVLDGDYGTVDEELSDDSTNPVQSKAIKKYIDDMFSQLSINIDDVLDLVKDEDKESMCELLNIIRCSDCAST